MAVDPSIRDLFDKAKGKPLLSLEFFPPKTAEAQEALSHTASAIAGHLTPDFVSITYGAGGSTRERTFVYGQYLREQFGWVVMPHLTCVGHSNDELIAIAESYERLGMRNIMALRGDPPKGQASFTPEPNGPQYANELVEILQKEVPQINLAVAGYPEKHPEASDMATDLANLKRKVDAGASFVTTQLFFDNDVYFKFVEAARKAGITVPILPGIMPVFSLDQAERFAQFCGAKIPERLQHRLERIPAAEQWRVGATWAAEQIEELLRSGVVPGIHLYIMNRSESLNILLAKLREKKLFQKKEQE